jgi:hypothetical protein
METNTLGASTVGALSVCDPAKIFSHPSLVLDFFATPPI